MEHKTNTAMSAHAYFDSECEELIHTSTIELTDIAKEKAQDLAEAALPRVTDDLNTYTSFITAKCNTLKSKVLSKLNVEGLKSKGRSLMERFTKHEDELKATCTELLSRLRDMKKEVSRLNAEDILGDIRRWKLVHPVILILIGIEALALEQAMGVLSSAGIHVRILISAGVCLSTYFLAKKHVILARKAEDRIRRIIVNIAMFSVSGLLFLLFGTLRMQFLSVMDTDLADRSNEWLFSGVSMTFYLGCVIAKSMYMPSADDRKRATLYTQMKEEYLGLQTSLKLAETELKTIPQEKEEALYKFYSLIKLAEKYTNQVDHAYQAIIGEFILENTIKRHDGNNISTAQYKGGMIPPLTHYEFNNEEL